jgi:AMP-binding enzyme C-terminal domain
MPLPKGIESELAANLSTHGGIEEVLAGHADVVESAVIGVADLFKGQLPLGLLALHRGSAAGDPLRQVPGRADEYDRRRRGLSDAGDALGTASFGPSPPAEASSGAG